MTQNQGFGKICDFPIVIAEQPLSHQHNSNVNEYNGSATLYKTTKDILEFAIALAQEKQIRSKKDYQQLLAEWGWEKEDRKYLKLATTFKNFTTDDLAAIEPDTLFTLAKSNKKYQPVIEQLHDIPQIDQHSVTELIRQQRRLKEKKSDTPTIWRRTRNGHRYCQIPSIHEEDEQTGTTLQNMIDSEGISAQRIVREAISLRQAYKQGMLVWTEDFSKTEETESSEDQQPNTSEEIEESDNHNQYSENANDAIQIISKQQSQVNSVENLTVSLSIDINDTDTVIENKEIQNSENIRLQLLQSKTWEQVENITRYCSDELKLSSWKLMSEEEKSYLHNLKQKFENHSQESNSSSDNNQIDFNLHIGDKVIWENAYAYMNCWQPFVITQIDKDKARLDIYKHPVPLSELCRV